MCRGIRDAAAVPYWCFVQANVQAESRVTRPSGGVSGLSPEVPER
jgi:hypothetical protein